MAGGMAKRFLDKYLEVEKGIVPVQNTPYTEPKTTNSTIQTNGATDRCMLPRKL